jgi:cold shock CspA family protein
LYGAGGGRQQLQSSPTITIRTQLLSSASTTASPSTSPTSPPSSEYVTGTVKNYIRDKAFGFVIPDGGTEADAIFVHRSGIKSTKLLPPNSAVTNPFLRRSERVRFLVVNEPSEKGSLKAAKELEYDDGTPIPIYRSAYVANVKKYTFAVLGETLYKIMQEEETDEAARQAKIKDSYDIARIAIESAQTRYDDMTALIKKKD